MVNNEFSDNLSKYANPEEYDKTYKNYTADLNFIKDYLSGSQKTIIELACGTGRLAIPLAKQGHLVYGIDIDEGMLKFAQHKVNSKGLSIHLSVQDCTQFKLPITSDFIYMTGNSFQHFLTNESQDALFRAVKDHLKPHGEFIFDTRNPILSELVMGDFSEETVIKNEKKIKIINQEVYNPLTQILECTSTYVTNENEYKDSIKLRYTYPLELKRLLHQHGFDVINIYGSWNKTAFDATSVSMVVHAKLK